MLLRKFGLKGGSKEAEVMETVNLALYKSIEEAKQAWQDAKIMYDEATERDNIDVLIHKINAYEREYIHLLKLARRESLRVFPDIK